MGIQSLRELPSMTVSADPEAASGAFMSVLGVIGGIPSVIGMLTGWPLAKKLGKKRAIVTGQIVYRQYGGTESVLVFLYLGMDMITFLVSIILLWRMNVENE